MKIRPFEDSTGTHLGYSFWCPGCDQRHAVYTSHSTLRTKGPVWQFNGDAQSPSFTPSLLNTWTHGESPEPRRCHLFISHGQIIYCSDCTHALAGQTVDLPDEDQDGAA